MPNLDNHFLQHALRIGARHLGRTMPNPSVGCVLVKDNQVIATGVTGIGGRPHAEALAVEAAGKAAKGATAYVTLEPCSHHGKTPPCADVLMKAGIKRVVIAATDPDSRVAGNGIVMLKNAGIEVTELKTDHPHRGFFRRVQYGLPYVMLKMATTSDGAMHDGTLTRLNITGDVALRHGHLLRGQSDAVLTGVGTVIADDPQLTCRIKGYEHPSLIRIIADRQLRTPIDSILVKTAEQNPTWILTLADTLEKVGSHAVELREQGVKILALEDMSPRGILMALAKEGIARLLIEAGPTLCEAFIEANSVDTLYWYRAPHSLNRTESGLIEAIAKTPRQAQPKQLNLGAYTLEILELNSCLPD